MTTTKLKPDEVQAATKQAFFMADPTMLVDHKHMNTGIAHLVRCIFVTVVVCAAQYGIQLVNHSVVASDDTKAPTVHLRV